MDNDPQNDRPDPSIFEAIKRNNNITVRNKIKSILNSPATERSQSLSRSTGTVEVSLLRTMSTEDRPLLGSFGYNKVSFSRIYEYGAEGTVYPEGMGVEAFDADGNQIEAYVILDFGEDNILVGVEEEGQQMSLGFDTESGNLTDDVERYDRELPDGFISNTREVNPREMISLESILNACETNL